MRTLEVTELTKSYKEKKALRGISFTIDKGEIFALIGPNGAGKTTTLRIVSTLLRAEGGDALVEGVSVRREPVEVRRKITYLPDEAGAYKNMTGRGYLRFMASLYSESREQEKAYVEYASEMTGLGDRLNDKISSYSKGMMRKLLISRAVMTKPALAILDEPTSGLDVINGLEIRRTLKNLAAEGMSFLISSHNMLEIEFLSDRVGLLNDGVLYETGAPAQLKEKYGAANLEEVFAMLAASGREG